MKSSPLSLLLSWRSPLVITFVIVRNGIDVQLSQNSTLIHDWHPSRLRHVLPEHLLKWMEERGVHCKTQPYPIIKQLWQQLAPHASKKCIVDASAVASLQEGDQPSDFALVWELHGALERIEGRYEGVDHYLGMGWFQKGTRIWSVKGHVSDEIEALIKNPVLPLLQIDAFFMSIIPQMQQYLPTRTHVQLITDFIPHVIVRTMSSAALTLSLHCNYPQLLPAIQVPVQNRDVLLADQIIIRFPYQTLTPAMEELLRRHGTLTIEGDRIPWFIREQLPIMLRYCQLDDDLAAKICQAYPVVSIDTVQPSFSQVHTVENGIGASIFVTTYTYQGHILDVDMLIAAHERRQRFVQQHGVWFECSANPREFMNTILRQRKARLLRPEEVMGFDTQRVGLLADYQGARAIQPVGTTPLERGVSVCTQLRLQGIPGGIIGDPPGLVSMFVKACEDLLHDNRQARILWIVPSTKKGSVTRAVQASTSNSFVTVASPVTLRDEPALFSRAWTLVIFHSLDMLLHGSNLKLTLPGLTWAWALVSVARPQFSMLPDKALQVLLMRVVHLPEHYSEQFCTHYLFDPLLRSAAVPTGNSTSTPTTAQKTPALPVKMATKQPPYSRPETAKPVSSGNVPHPGSVRPGAKTSDQRIRPHSVPAQTSPVQQTQQKPQQVVHATSHVVNLMEQTSSTASSQSSPIQTSQNQAQSQITRSTKTPPPVKQSQVQPASSSSVPPVASAPGGTGNVDSQPGTPQHASPPTRRSFELNQNIVVRLQQEAEQLRERLTVEDEDVQEQVHILPITPPISNESMESRAVPNVEVHLVSVDSVRQESADTMPYLEQSQNKSVDARSNTHTAKLSFGEQARNWKERSHGPTLPAQYTHDRPEYACMDTNQLNWYFYWRSEVRAGRYLATDVAYIYVHVYEALGCIGFPDPVQACERLIALWTHYRSSFPDLDTYLVPWIADFCVVYALPLTAMQWYTRLLTVPDCSRDAPLIAEAWLQQGADWTQIPTAVLYRLIGFPTHTTLYQEMRQKLALDDVYRRAIAAVDEYLCSKFDRPALITRYGKGRWQTVERIPFHKAFVEHAYAPITVATIHAAFTDAGFLQAVSGIVNYADHVQRKLYQKAVAPFDPTIDISWQDVIDTLVKNEAASPSHGSQAQELTAHAPPPSSLVSQPGVHLNMQAIATLREESHRLQGRLSVEQEDEEEGQEVQPPDIPPLSQTRSAMLIGTDAEPEVDEDWLHIAHQWQQEHWKLLRLLQQAQHTQLTVIERQARRPLSRLIDEVNAPVDEVLGDLLIDPDTRTITSYLESTAGILIEWYFSEKKRR